MTVSAPLPPMKLPPTVPELVSALVPLLSSTSSVIVPELITVSLPLPPRTPKLKCTIVPELMSLLVPSPRNTSPDIIFALTNVSLPLPPLTAVVAAPIVPLLVSLFVPSSSSAPSIVPELKTVSLPLSPKTAKRIAPEFVSLLVPLAGSTTTHHRSGVRQCVIAAAEIDVSIDRSGIRHLIGAEPVEVDDRAANRPGIDDVVRAGILNGDGGNRARDRPGILDDRGAWATMPKNPPTSPFTVIFESAAFPAARWMPSSCCENTLPLIVTVQAPAALRNAPALFAPVAVQEKRLGQRSRYRRLDYCRRRRDWRGRS